MCSRPIGESYGICTMSYRKFTFAISSPDEFLVMFVAIKNKSATLSHSSSSAAALSKRVSRLLAELAFYILMGIDSCQYMYGMCTWLFFSAPDWIFSVT